MLRKQPKQEVQIARVVKGDPLASLDLSEDERRAINEVRSLATVLDGRYGVGPFKLGADALFGLVPAGFGDAFMAIFALYAVWRASTALRLPPDVWAVMVLRVIGDMAAAGIISLPATFFPPLYLLDFLVDSGLKANAANIKHMEQYLLKRHNPTRPPF